MDVNGAKTNPNSFTSRYLKENNSKQVIISNVHINVEQDKSYIFIKWYVLKFFVDFTDS